MTQLDHSCDHVCAYYYLFVSSHTTNFFVVSASFTPASCGNYVGRFKCSCSFVLDCMHGSKDVTCDNNAQSSIMLSQHHYSIQYVRNPCIFSMPYCSITKAMTLMSNNIFIRYFFPAGQGS